MLLVKKIKIYFRLFKNFNKIAKIKSIYFFVFTMPIFGYFFYLFGRLLLKINSKRLIVFFFQHKIFLSTIRFFDIESLKEISKILPAYNELNIDLPYDCTINKLNGNNILDSLKKYGHASLGKIFTDDECNNLINYLENKLCFNGQTPMQSEGNQITFSYKDIKNNLKKNAYYSFGPDIVYDYAPLNQFISNKNLNNIIDNYLNFKNTIYSSVTWFNPQAEEEHYVYSNHRDNDDFKFLGMIIYWTNVDINSGATCIVEKSHIKNNQTTIKNLEGPAGTVYLADLSSLHSGTSIKSRERFTTFLRFGKFFNHCTVIDCGAQTPGLK